MNQFQSLRFHSLGSYYNLMIVVNIISYSNRNNGRCITSSIKNMKLNVVFT